MAILERGKVACRGELARSCSGSLFDHAARTQTGIEGKPPPFIFHSGGGERCQRKLAFIDDILPLLGGPKLGPVRSTREKRKIRSDSKPSNPSVPRGSAARVRRKNCFFRMEIDRGRKHGNFDRLSPKDASPARSRFYEMTTRYVPTRYSRLRKTRSTFQCVFPRTRHCFIDSAINWKLFLIEKNLPEYYIDFDRALIKHLKKYFFTIFLLIEDFSMVYSLKEIPYIFRGKPSNH